MFFKNALGSYTTEFVEIPEEADDITYVLSDYHNDVFDKFFIVDFIIRQFINLLHFGDSAKEAIKAVTKTFLKSFFSRFLNLIDSKLVEKKISKIIEILEPYLTSFKYETVRDGCLVFRQLNLEIRDD